jgi:hypothetical protein
VPVTLFGQLAGDKDFQGQRHTVPLLLFALKTALCAAESRRSIGVIHSLHPMGWLGDQSRPLREPQLCFAQCAYQGNFVDCAITQKLPREQGKFDPGIALHIIAGGERYPGEEVATIIPSPIV